MGSSRPPPGPKRKLNPKRYLPSFQRVSSTGPSAVLNFKTRSAPITSTVPVKRAILPGGPIAPSTDHALPCLSIDLMMSARSSKARRFEISPSPCACPPVDEVDHLVQLHS